ncbi:MAG: hypothetical protein R3F62_19150 [Planctomycetota bacterium]
MSTPSRETALRVIVPSLALAVGYGLFLAPADRRGELEARLVKARAQAQAGGAPVGIAGRVRALEARQGALEERLQELKGGHEDHERMRALRDVVEAFAAHDVLLLNEVDGGGEGFALPLALSTLPQLTAPGATPPTRGAPPPVPPSRHLSQLRLRGSYFAVLETLEALAQDTGSAAFVVGVDLDRTDPSGQHLWTVVVWV